MTRERLSLGKEGEDFAAAYLKKLGYRIRERNFRTPLGEIDIIALDGNTLVFVEVKTRRSHAFGLPFEAVNRKKREQIAKAARYYMAGKRVNDMAARVDIVSVMSDGEEMRAEVIRNAFDVPS